MKLRFEISNLGEKNILTVYLLKGDFSEGKIANVCFQFTDYEDLQKVLNISVNELIGDLE